MKPHVKVNVMLFVTVLLWASAFVGIRIALIDFSPGALALFRFAIASICMLFFYFFLPRAHRIAWPDRIKLLLLGMVGIGVYNVCLNYGELSVTAGIASFIIGLMPMMTLLISVVFLKERPGLLVYVGLCISISGLLTMTFIENAHLSNQRGMLAILLSAVSGAIYAIFLRRFLNRYHPVMVSTWCIWGGALLLSIFARPLWYEIGRASMSPMMACIYMGIFPAAIAYVAWSYVLGFVAASKATLYLYALPIVSTLMGALFLHENPSNYSLLGGGLALTGALFASYHLRQKKKVTPTVLE